MIFRKLSVALIGGITILLSPFQLKAQCPGAVLDSACLSSLISSGGGICSSTLPPGMVGQPYDADVSFVMPKRVSVTSPVSITVDLLQINITGMSGAPTGLRYSCDGFSHAPCEYFPQSGENLGAVKICGTPLVAGSYNVTVYIHAIVDAGTFGRQVSDQTYNTSIVIQPDTSGGVATFSYVPGTRTLCDSGTYQFRALYSSTTNPVRYEWDFGNGNISNDTVPPLQTYNVPGTYRVSLRTIVYNYKVTDFSVSATDGSRWSGDVEELTTLSIPDFYWKIPAQGYTSNTINENFRPVWSGLNVNIPPGTSSINYELWEEDTRIPIFGSPDDFVARGTIPCRWGVYSWLDMGSAGAIKFDTVRGDVFFDTLLVTVATRPVVSSMTVNKDSFCAGDSALLYISSVPGSNYQWYNDTAVVPLANDNIFVTHGSGDFSVMVTNIASGCETRSEVRHIESFPVPPNILSIIPAAPGLLVNSNFPGAGFSIEWYKNGVLMPGANSQLLNHWGDGYYTARVYNTAFPECDVISAPFFVSGISESDPIAAAFNISPNPSSGVFAVNAVLPDVKVEKFVLINMDGQMIGEVMSDSKDASIQQILNFNAPGSGLYILRIITDKGAINKKIIIQ